MRVQRAHIPVVLYWGIFAFATLWQTNRASYGSTALILGSLFLLARFLPKAQEQGAGERFVHFAMVAFGVALAVRTATSPHWHDVLVIASQWAMYPLAYGVARTTRQPAARTLFYAFLAPLLIGFAGWAVVDHTFGNPIFGPTADSNAFATMMAVCLVVSLGLAATEPRIRVAVLSLCPVVAFALYLTTSRGTLIALPTLGMAALSFYIAGTRGGLSARMKAGMLGALFAALLAGAAYGTSYIARQLQQDEISLGARVAMLKTGVEIGMSQGPWVGEGIGTFARYYPEWRTLSDPESAGVRAHNDYVELFADGGLLLSFLLVLTSVAVWRAFALTWFQGPSRQGAYLAGAAYLALYAALNHVYVGIFLSLLAGAFLGWGTQNAAGDSSANQARSWVQRHSLLVVTAAILLTLIPGLAFHSVAQMHVRAALSSPTTPLWGPSERALQFFAESGVVPQAAFVYGLRSEVALSALPQNDPGRKLAARAALAHYIRAYEQDIRDASFAYQIARVLANHEEFAGERIANQTDLWFRTAIRLDKLNFQVVLSYSRWLASRGEYEKALLQLNDSVRRSWRPGRRQPLLDEINRIQTLVRSKAASDAESVHALTQ